MSINILYPPGSSGSGIADYQFPPEVYASKVSPGTPGDGAVASDVATNATNTITSATIAADPLAVGKWICINGSRGSTDVPTLATITGVAGNSITINPIAANFAPNGTFGGLNAVWGTDSQPAFVQAHADGKTYAQKNNSFYQVPLQHGKIYVVATLRQTNGSPWLINSQIWLPGPDSNNGRKLVQSMIGVGRDDHFQYWNSTIPNLSGAVIFSMQTAPLAQDATFLRQSVIGVSSGLNGLPTGVFAARNLNQKPTFEDIQIWMPLYTNMTGIDTEFASGTYIDGVGVHSFAQAAGGNGANLNGIYTDTSVYGTRAGVGINLPAYGNNADVIVPSLTCEGITMGLRTPSEHVVVGSYKTIYCAVVLGVVGAGATTAHGITINHVTAEAYQTGILNIGEAVGPTPINITQWTTESDIGSVSDVIDTANGFTGLMRFFDIVDGRRPVVNGAAKLKIIDDSISTGVWAGAPAVPATGVAVAQTAMPWRDATVRVNGGTVTAITVDGQIQQTTTGTTVRVPAGKTISVTYSVAPTWIWWLD